MHLTLSVTTPEKKIFEAKDITSISFPTVDGEITVLPHHIPLLTKTTTGEIVVRYENHEDSLVVTEGFLKIDNAGNCLVLADYAVRSDDIDILKVQEAKEKAENIMKEKINEKDFVIAEAELRKTLMELKISQRKRASNIRK